MSVNKAFSQSIKMVNEGAAIIDIGGESTRPGAHKISIQQELDRVIPIIEKVCKEIDVLVSVDTSKPAVMHEAIKAGAKMVNDVNALQSEGAMELAKYSVLVCLMHMQGKPQTMQQKPSYTNVIQEVITFLQNRMQACVNSGIAHGNIVIDPGFGFGKTVEHNLLLIKHMQEISSLGAPVLIGVSRKSTIGVLLDSPVNERLNGSLALATIACLNGASIIRTHDVKATVDSVKICQAVMNVRQK